jgi:hypothetical protein
MRFKKNNNNNKISNLFFILSSSISCDVITNKLRLPLKTKFSRQLKTIKNCVVIPYSYEVIHRLSLLLGNTQHL